MCKKGTNVKKRMECIYNCMLNGNKGYIKIHLFYVYIKIVFSRSTTTRVLFTEWYLVKYTGLWCLSENMGRGSDREKVENPSSQPKERYCAS